MTKEQADCSREVSQVRFHSGSNCVFASLTSMEPMLRHAPTLSAP